MPDADGLPDGDRSEAILDALREARALGCPVYIHGGGSKRDLIGRACDADALQVAAHRGIVDYQPRELVITARAGTPIRALQDVLREQGQMLAFEPPDFGGRATLGGTLACNLAGPARPWAGAVRDAVLGVRLVTGRCEPLAFGGQVMKNVAGFDVSRLQAGALGTLGVITEVSLKVLPLPETSLTLCYAMSAAQALETMNRRAGEAAPLSGALWLDGRLYLRLSGAASAVTGVAARWGGEQLANEQAPWEGVREMTLPFFAGDAPLWRFSVPALAPVAFEPTLIDWCGALRWLRGEYPRETLQGAADAAGGQLALFRGGDRRREVRTPLGAVEQALQRRLKQAFDPERLLNPGRLYSWL